jgi:cell division protein FtsB
MNTDQLLEKQTANTAAQDKIKAEIAELSRSAPASRSADQNARLQALETERQALVKEAADLAAGTAAPKSKK